MKAPTQNAEKPPAVCSRLTDIQFQQTLIKSREIDGYTVQEIAEICTTPYRTIESWISGKRIPTDAVKADVLKILSKPNRPLSKRKTEEHGLTWDKAKRRWVLKLTLDIDKRLVGHRIVVHLRTTDARVAIAKREAILDAFGKLGIKVSKRAQRRKAEGAP